MNFEIEGRDGSSLQRFYAALFDWEFVGAAASAAEYGLILGVDGAASSVPATPSSTWRGPRRDEGYAGHVTVYVEVVDVEAAVAHAESLGGVRMQGPDQLEPGVEI